MEISSSGYLCCVLLLSFLLDDFLLKNYFDFPFRRICTSILCGLLMGNDCNWNFKVIPGPKQNETYLITLVVYSLVDIVNKLRKLLQCFSKKLFVVLSLKNFMKRYWKIL